MNSEPTPQASEDKRKPKALRPYLALWACLAICAALALSAILLQN